MEAAIAADSAAMSKRMSFDRPGQAGGGGPVPAAGPAGADAANNGGVSSGPAVTDEGAVDAAGQAINQLFAPPDFNEAATYYDSMEKAKTEGKWILVNIQQAEVFASHQLNRDVWRDETIKDIIMGSFVFWQRDDKSTEGEQFCQYHQCGHQLPHICVIDPRTGRKVKNWDGRKWVESHVAAEYLFGFLDEHSMDRAPVTSPNMSPSGSPRVTAAGDPAAIAADVELTGLDDAMGVAAAGGSEGDVQAAAAEPAEPPEAMPEEPPDSVEHLKVSFRLPSGSRLVRRFLPDDTLGRMFAVVSAASEQPMSALELSTTFPTRSLRDIEGGMGVLLKDAGVAGAMVNVTSKLS